MVTKKRPIRKRMSKTDYERLSAFRYALRKFLKFSEEAAEAAGLTARQHQALLAIKGFPGRDHITNGELAERLKIQHQSAVGLVNRLEEKVMVARVAGDADGRESYVRVTRSGEAVLERLAAAHKTELKRIGPELASILQSFG
jgi:DNA-binding MarR family transcriptional regulator